MLQSHGNKERARQSWKNREGITLDVCLQWNLSNLDTPRQECGVKPGTDDSWPVFEVSSLQSPAKFDELCSAVD